jgi:hypothetical protein
VRWHRAGFKAYWNRLSQHRAPVGRKHIGIRLRAARPPKFWLRTFLPRVEVQREERCVCWSLATQSVRPSQPSVAIEHLPFQSKIFSKAVPDIQAEFFFAPGWNFGETQHGTRVVWTETCWRGKCRTSRRGRLSVSGVEDCWRQDAKRGRMKAVYRSGCWTRCWEVLFSHTPLSVGAHLDSWSRADSTLHQPQWPAS